MLIPAWQAFRASDTARWVFPLCKALHNGELCKVISYVKLSTKLSEITSFTMEFLSIILHDGCDACASIKLKEGFYESGKIHQESRIRSIGTT
jgi:hypothetical protein